MTGELWHQLAEIAAVRYRSGWRVSGTNQFFDNRGEAISLHKPEGRPITCSEALEIAAMIWAIECANDEDGTDT